MMMNFKGFSALYDKGLLTPGTCKIESKLYISEYVYMWSFTYFHRTVVQLCEGTKINVLDFRLLFG